jgi:uncharacterized protein YjbI with pentapeptide repeats
MQANLIRAIGIRANIMQANVIRANVIRANVIRANLIRAKVGEPFVYLYIKIYASVSEYYLVTTVNILRSAANLGSL